MSTIHHELPEELATEYFFVIHAVVEDQENVVLPVAALPHLFLRVHDALNRALIVVFEDHALWDEILESFFGGIFCWTYGDGKNPRHIWAVAKVVAQVSDDRGLARATTPDEENRRGHWDLTGVPLLDLEPIFLGRIFWGNRRSRRSRLDF